METNKDNISKEEIIEEDCGSLDTPIKVWVFSILLAAIISLSLFIFSSWSVKNLLSGMLGAL